jgi:hypothetical protein
VTAMGVPHLLPLLLVCILSSMDCRPQVGRDIAQLVWEKSNGLPAFIEQLVTYLQMQLSQRQTGLAKQAPAQPHGGGVDGPEGESGIRQGWLRSSDLVGQLQLHAWCEVKHGICVRVHTGRLQASHARTCISKMPAKTPCKAFLG